MLQASLVIKRYKKNCVLFFLICCVLSSPKLYAAATVPSLFSDTSLQYPLLIIAILKSDPELYSKEMSRLLYGPATDFIRAVYFITSSGDTIFHLMAKVQFHHDFFYSEIKNLHNLLFPKEFIFMENISLGGIKMPKPDDLEKTAIGRAILRQDIPAILNESDKLHKGPAIELFQILHAKIRTNDSYSAFIKKNLSLGQLMAVWDQVLLTTEIKKYIGESRFSLFTENNINDISLYAKAHAVLIAENNRETRIPGLEFFGIFSAFYGISLISEEYPSLIASLHPETITWERATDMPLLILTGMLEWVVYSSIGAFVIQKCRQAFIKKKSKAPGT